MGRRCCGKIVLSRLDSPLLSWIHSTVIDNTRGRSARVVAREGGTIAPLRLTLARRTIMRPAFPTRFPGLELAERLA